MGTRPLQACEARILAKNFLTAPRGVDALVASLRTFMWKTMTRGIGPRSYPSGRAYPAGASSELTGRASVSRVNARHRQDKAAFREASSRGHGGEVASTCSP